MTLAQLLIIATVTLAATSRLPMVLSQLYKDPSQPIHERVADLLKEMTMDEKIAQLLEVYSDSSYARDNYAKTGVGWLPIPGSTPADSVSKRNQLQQLFMNRWVAMSRDLRRVAAKQIVRLYARSLTALDCIFQWALRRRLCIVQQRVAPCSLCLSLKVNN